MATAVKSTEGTIWKTAAEYFYSGGFLPGGMLQATNGKNFEVVSEAFRLIGRQQMIQCVF